MALGRSMGRPSSYTAELVESICERLMEGESLRSICRDDAMPDFRTVMRWQAEDEDFATKCARAREEQAEFHHAEMDRLEGAVEDGSLAAAAASVILANKRWRMEKLKPKVYGAKIQHGSDPENPIPAPIFIMQPTAPAKALE